jgi:hypothetical protein
MVSGVGNALSSVASGVGSVFSGIGSTISSVVSGVGTVLGDVVGGVGALLTGTSFTAEMAAITAGEMTLGASGAVAAGTGAGVMAAIGIAIPWVAGAYFLGEALGFWGSESHAPASVINSPEHLAVMQERRVAEIESMFGGQIPLDLRQEYNQLIAARASRVTSVREDWYAYGTDRIVSSPTVFGAGEAGPERVTISPLNGAARHGMGGGPSVNFNGPMVMDYYTMRQFLRSLEKYSR